MVYEDDDDVGDSCMSETRKLRIPFRAPLQEGDTEETTIGCRANNPDICANNGLKNICAFASSDGICRKPSRAWKKQYAVLLKEKMN